MSAQVPCTHCLTPNSAGLLSQVGGGAGGSGRKRGCDCQVGLGLATCSQALLWCLQQHLLEIGLFASLSAGPGGRGTHLWVSAIARSGREDRVSEMQEGKEKAPSSLSSLFPLWPVQVHVLFSPGLHSVHSSLACQARAMLSASVVGTLAQCGAEIRCLPGRGAGGGGAWILLRQSLLSRSQQFQCERLESQISGKNRATLSPLGGAWRGSHLFLFLFPWVCP